MSIKIRPLEPIPITPTPQELALSLTNRITPFLALKTARNHQNYPQHYSRSFFQEHSPSTIPLPTRPLEPLQDNIHER